MKPLLQRQIDRYLPDGIASTPALSTFLEVVGRTYSDLESDSRFLAHTLEVTSQELTEANERIRREMEGQVSQISDRFERTLDLQPNLIFRCHQVPHGYEVSLARGGLLERLGLQREQLEHQALEVWLPRESAGAFCDRAWQGKQQRFDATLGPAKTKCQVSLYPLFEAGAVVELIGSVETVEVQRQIEAQLRETSEDLALRAHELEQHRRVMLSMIEDLDLSRSSIAHERDRANALAEELREAKDVAEAANKAKSEFLATMSHEIRTPLHGMVSAAELLASGALDERQGRLVDTMHAAAEHLLGLVNDILDFSKIEAGRLELDVEDFDLRRLVAECADLFRLQAERKGLRLETVLQLPETCAARGDCVRVRQMLANLIGNAVKFTAQGAVTVRAAIEGEKAAARIVLEVSDTGVGLEPWQQAGLFQPFTQFENAAVRRHGGTGLGLAITKRIAYQMGGEVEVRSAAGQGSVFTLRLPFSPGLARRAAPRPVRARRHEKLRVLVVDDTEANMILMRMLLEDLGHECLACSSGAAAIRLCREERPDVVLMDVHMPDMDGIETTRRIVDAARAADPSRSPPRIVALTADVRLENRRACLEAGMQGFATKPVRRQELMAILSGEGSGLAPRPALREIPLVDLALAGEIFRAPEAGRAATVGPMLRDFVSDARRELQELATEGRALEPLQLAAKAHRLAGTIANYSFSRSAALLRQIELQADRLAPEAIDQGLSKAVVAFAEGLERLRREFPEYASWLPSGDDSEGPVIGEPGEP